MAEIITSAMVDGDPSAPILVIAMAPGREELTANRPLVGASGKLTWALARRGGWSRADCYIINTIGEWPAKADGNPTEAQLEQYWDQFNAYLARSNAKVAVCLGGAAFDRLTAILTTDRRAKRRSGIEAWRGYLVARADCGTHTRRVVRWEQYKTNTPKHRKGDPKLTRHRVVEQCTVPDSLGYIIPTIHPAAVLRTGYATLPALSADLARVGRALRGELRPTAIGGSFSTTPRTEVSGDAVSFDIETRGTIVGAITVRMGIADGLGPWTSEWDTRSRAASIAILGEPGRTKVGHNIVSFDIPKLAADGVEVADPIFDTMLAASLLQPDLYKGLNACASLYLDCPRWKHENEARPDYYNAMDAQGQLELYHAECAELKRTGQYEWFTKVMMPGARVLAKMTERGIKLDQKRRDEWLADLRVREEAAETEWYGLTGCSPSSNKQVQAFLYETSGLPISYNKYGGTTADAASLKEALTWLGRQKESAPRTRTERALSCLLRYREVSKLRSTYAEYPLGDDGCIHPSYLPATKDDDNAGFGKGLAGTGRITSRNPNIQNQPPEARRLYVPHRADLILVEADYSQIELRVVAALSDDKALREALEGDVHSHTQALLGVDRVRAKNVMYGTIYGAGPRKLSMVLKARGYDISERDARELQDALARAYPGLWRWRTRIVEEVGRTFKLATPFGMHRYFYGGRRDAPAAIDFLPQGTAAGITWQILPPLEAAMQAVGGALLNLVHDSTLNEVPRTRLEEGIAALKGVMEVEWPQIEPGFRVPVSVKVGENWGEMKPVS